MISLEDQLLKLPDSGAQFLADCEEVFSCQAGRRMLLLLTSMANPLFTPLRATLEETCVAIGQKEVVTLLWSRAPAQEFNPHTAQT